MSEACVELGDRDTPVSVRINGPNPTFHLATDRIAAQLARPVAPVFEDLLEIACTVFAADSGTKRGGDTRSGMGADWRRDFRFGIPVRNPAFWSRSDVTEALETAVGFMTEDQVRFRFFQREPDAPRQMYLDLDPDAALFAAEEVILFSGGLDSFAGALEALTTTKGRVVLVTHRSAQKAIKRQVELGRYLSDRFPGRVLHIHVRATRAGSQGPETTQRSRSFLFAALGQVIARTLGASRVSFYENGIISHNLPISPQVIGSMATRTTHPMTLLRLNALMDLIGPKRVPIANAYEWLTKSEVVAKIVANGGTDRIKQAVSCTSIRDQDTLMTHCGACSQCIDRRFATLANGVGDEDPDIHYRTDVLFGDREAPRSRTMAVDWIRHSLRLGGMDRRTLMQEFGQDITRIARGHEGLDGGEVLGKALDLYTRHANAVRGVLSMVVRNRADDIVARAFPPTSLLMLHIGSGGGLAAGVFSDPRPIARKIRPIGEIDEVDVAPDADRPLEVKFVGSGEDLVIAVNGMCEISGRPAKVAGSLKHTFDADRRECRARSDHAYLTTGEIARDLETTKDAVTQNVRRCRGTLADAYAAIFGQAPPRPLLIESRKPDGYRLDPDIRIIG